MSKVVCDDREVSLQLLIHILNERNIENAQLSQWGLSDRDNFENLRKAAQTALDLYLAWKECKGDQRKSAKRRYKQSVWGLLRRVIEFKPQFPWLPEVVISI